MTDLSWYYSTFSNSELLTALELRPDAYTDDAWKILNAEVDRRELVRPDHPIDNGGLIGEGSFALEGTGGTAASTDFSLDPSSRGEIEAARRQRRRGLFWLAGGVGMTALGYASAMEGGSYTLFYGAMLVGAYNLIRGNVRMEKARGIDPLTGKPAVKG